MKHSISRRSLLARFGYAAACGSGVWSLRSVAHAQEQAESAVCLSMLYRNGPEATFDASRYATQYLPMLKSVCGDSAERIELHTPRPLAMPGTSGSGRMRPSGSHTPQPAAQSAAPPTPLLAAVSIWIRDVRAFGERTAAAGQLGPELQQVTGIEPLMQFNSVLSLLGDARASIPAQASVFSTYFPTTEGAQFDPRYYGEKVIPLMIKLYGAKSIRRVEFTAGVTQGGNSPLVTASSHFYIRDRAAWDAAGMQAYPQLMAEGPKYTTIRPLAVDMQVVATG
jgi:hypothetical protein